MVVSPANKVHLLRKQTSFTTPKDNRFKVKQASFAFQPIFSSKIACFFFNLSQSLAKSRQTLAQLKSESAVLGSAACLSKNRPDFSTNDVASIIIWFDGSHSQYGRSNTLLRSIKYRSMNGQILQYETSVLV